MDRVESAMFEILKTLSHGYGVPALALKQTFQTIQHSGNEEYIYFSDVMSRLEEQLMVEKLQDFGESPIATYIITSNGSDYLEKLMNLKLKEKEKEHTRSGDREKKQDQMTEESVMNDILRALSPSNRLHFSNLASSFPGTESFLHEVLDRLLDEDLILITSNLRDPTNPVYEISAAGVDHLKQLEHEYSREKSNALIESIYREKEPAQSNTKTFICYSSKDLDFAMKLAGELRASGFNVWFDRLDIAPGQRWAREVDRALHACENFIVILSPHSVESDNVDDEIGVAVEEKKKIIPIMVSQCRTPLRIRSLQHIDFIKDYEQGINRLKATLNGLPAGRNS